MAVIHSTCVVCSGDFKSYTSSHRKRCFACTPKEKRRTVQCLECGSDFASKVNGAGLRQACCSRKCGTAMRDRAHRAKWEPIEAARALARVAAKAVRARRLDEARKARTAERARMDEERRLGRPKKACAVCGTHFLPAFKGPRSTCSPSCRDVWLKLQRAKARSHYGRKYRQRAKPGAVVEKGVTRLRVFMRDGWRCQICGVRTPKRLSGSYDLNAPELDHILPLAKGGDHAWHNVQCVCRRCNIEKSDRIIGQLRLAI